MKRWLILFALLFIITGCSPETNCADDPACKRVLFIGNSYTYVNDLPGTFTDLAKSGGHRVETDMSAQGGWSLADHVNSAETLDKIKSSKWNYVVLQEQSQMPASKQAREMQMYPAARTLVTEIRKTGAEPIFFETWAHSNGWPENNMPVYGTMQANINEGYLAIAQELNVKVSPVGLAWFAAVKQKSPIKLWQDDGSHPSVAGTYLAACVFYKTLFQESPEGLSYKNGLSTENAQWLQKIAADTVNINTTK